MKNLGNKGQIVIEYYVLLVVAVIVLIIAFQPEGFIASGIDEKVIISERDLDEYARCVRFCGNAPCPPTCGNACCEPGEDETNCQQDCAGCVPLTCNFENCGVIPDGCGQFINCPPCGCERKNLEIGNGMYGEFPRAQSGSIVAASCPQNYIGEPIRQCIEGKWGDLSGGCEVISNIH